MPDSSTGDFPTPPETTPSSPFVNISNDDLRGIQHNLSKLSASLNFTPESKQSRSRSRLSKISKMSDAQPKTKSDFIEPDFVDADIITATQHGATNRCVQLLESGDFNPTEVDEEAHDRTRWRLLCSTPLSLILCKCFQFSRPISIFWELLENL